MSSQPAPITSDSQSAVISTSDQPSLAEALSTTQTSTEPTTIPTASSKTQKPRKRGLSLEHFDDSFGTSNDDLLLMKTSTKKPSKSFILGDDGSADQQLVSLLSTVQQIDIIADKEKEPETNTSTNELKFISYKMAKKVEKETKEELEKKWEDDQKRIKAQPLIVIFSWWTATGGNRMEVEVKKGDTIRSFLHAAYQTAGKKLGNDAVRKISPENLIYVKEDLILPNNYTFYDFIAINARGKSGTLVDFGFHDDIRLMSNFNEESKDVHVGKVMDRALYMQKKDTFPYDRFEEYDAKKDYGKYTIA